MSEMEADRHCRPTDRLQGYREVIAEAGGVLKLFGERAAFDGIDPDVQPGAWFGLRGPTAADKPTPRRMSDGASGSAAGRIRVFGLDIADDARAVRARPGV